tara:strand:+ start:329 stop:499 length:171 start_codon:yes stop_codon:yes gene_type:complete
MMKKYFAKMFLSLGCIGLMIANASCGGSPPSQDEDGPDQNKGETEDTDTDIGPGGE